MRVEPAVGVAGHYGTWTVTWEAATWHVGECNSANRLQATDPEGDHYACARAARVVAKVEPESPDFLVKSSRPGLDGRLERYVFVSV